MTQKKLLLSFIFILISGLTYGQSMRYGECRNAASPERFYLIPYAGLGLASIKTDSIKSKHFTYMGGITALYKFDAFRIGLGARYQGYSQDSSDFAYLKPYLAIEVPLYFDEFADLGFFTSIGPSLAISGTKINGFFADFGAYYNLVINSSSAIYFGLDYGYNSYNYKNNLATITTKYSEIKLRVGYRFWF